MFPISNWKLGFDTISRNHEFLEIQVLKASHRSFDPPLTLRKFSEDLGDPWNPWADYKFANDLANPNFSQDENARIREQIEERFFQRNQIAHAVYQLVLKKVEVLAYTRGEKSAHSVEVLETYEFRSTD